MYKRWLLYILLSLQLAVAMLHIGIALNKGIDAYQEIQSTNVSHNYYLNIFLTTVPLLIVSFFYTGAYFNYLSSNIKKATLLTICLYCYAIGNTYYIMSQYHWIYVVLLAINLMCLFLLTRQKHVK